MTTLCQSDTDTGQTGFGPLLWAEWIKFRTVRGWVLGMVVAALVTAGIALLDHSSCGGQATPDSPVVVGLGCAAPIGPGGEAVTDSFSFLHQTLTGDGGITVRLASLTAGSATTRLQPWSKAGIIIKASTRQGSAYAAMMVTAGHGVRMQYDYIGDIAGLRGTGPRWLRLTRTGDALTGYESTDGTRWTVVGTTHLAGLPTTVQTGMFAASPVSSQATSQSVAGGSATGAMTAATAAFDHVNLSVPARTWTSSQVGGASPGAGFRQTGGVITVTGTGDIAPSGNGTPIERTLLGAFAALIAVIVVATMFMTGEYRRGLIRVTFAASPLRGRVLAAKAVVIGSVAFAAGLAGSIAALVFGERLQRSNGNFFLPVSGLTEVRVVAGTGALLAVTAVLALALGALLRRSAGAVAIVIAATVLPYLLATTVLPAAAADLLLRGTPAAAFAIQQSIPRYSQVSASYTPKNGYYPLAPWAGFTVLCCYTALALGLAIILLRRRDA